jgi:hypothetical protein
MSKKMDPKSLRTAAKELNEIFGLDPKINVKADDKEITAKLTEAIKLIDAEDEFSEITTEVINALKGDAPAKGKKGKKVEEEEDEEEDVEDTEDAEDEDEADDDVEEAEEEDEEEVPVKKGKKGKKAVEEEEDEDEAEEEDEDAEEEDAEESLKDQIDGASKLSELKTIAEDNVEFKSLKKRLHAFKKASELKEEMLGLIEEDDEEAQEIAEKIHKKNIGNKKVNKGKDAEEEDDDEEEEAPKKKAKVTDGKKKPNPFVKNGPSMQDIADKLFKTKADKATIKKEFTAAYKEKKDITDQAFITKRINTYMKIAEEKAGKAKGKK